MIKELDKRTLTRLYVKEKFSLRAIAKMYGRSYFCIRYRCIKYGIKARPREWGRKIRLDKSLLQRLYVKERKSANEIAEMLSCSSSTVLKRCKEYGIPLKGRKIEGITKEQLQLLYVEEGKTTKEIGKLFNCSGNAIRRRCKQLGVPLRNPGTKKCEIDIPTLRRLHAKEKKSNLEIAKIFNCSPSVISNRIKRFGLKRRKGR